MKLPSLSLTKLVSFAKYVPKRAALFSAIGIGMLIPVAANAWGPERSTFTVDKPANGVALNSITNNPVQGDERNFMQIKQTGASASTYADSISLKPDTEYTFFIYYANNANPDLNASGRGVAKGAYVKADIPDYVNDGQTRVNANGYVGANKVAQVFDEVYLSNTTGSNLSLTYVKGSAVIHNDNKTNGQKLSDSIVTSGAKIGNDSLNGTLKGGAAYSGFVSFRAKTGPAKTTAATPARQASTTPSFTVQKEVRKVGTTAWSESVSVVPGDTVQYLITYTNTGSGVQNNVTVRDALPAGVSYVSGSSTLKNGQNPSGKTVGNGVTGSTGINIGNYEAAAVGYLYFTVRVNQPSTCGTTTLTNSAKVTVGSASKSDTAAIAVTTQCATTTTPSQTTTSTPSTTTTTTTQPETTPVTTIQSTTTATNTGTTQPAVTTTQTTQPAATTVTTQTTTPATTTTPTTTSTAETTPAPATTEPAPTTTPSTGPADVAGGLIGMSSLGMGAHHYLQSRRVLRKARG